MPLLIWNAAITGQSGGVSFRLFRYKLFLKRILGKWKMNNRDGLEVKVGYEDSLTYV